MCVHNFGFLYVYLTVCFYDFHMASLNFHNHFILLFFRCFFFHFTWILCVEYVNFLFDGSFFSCFFLSFCFLFQFCFVFYLYIFLVLPSMVLIRK